MIRDPEREELTRLISGLLDDQLSSAEQERLESMLKADPHARRLYMQMIDQEIELPCLVASAEGKAAAQPLARDFGRERRRDPTAVGVLSRRWVFGAAIALGMMILLVTLAWFQKSQRSQPVTPVVSAHDSWQEDFEGNLRASWYGRMVTNNLPAGSKYGIAPIVREYPEGDPSYVIQLPEDWNQGLFALTTGSTLNVTYRKGNRAHINVFMHTIPSELGPEQYAMYQLGGAAPFSGRIGEWLTVSIPFSQFVRKVAVEPGGARQFVGGPPRAGERITTLVFSSVEEADLVIDRVWVTPTRPENK
jgi:hypothetical protein